MPRCTDGKWCIDDMCHGGGRTLCGIDRENYDLDGEMHDPHADYDEDPYPDVPDEGADT